MKLSLLASSALAATAALAQPVADAAEATWTRVPLPSPSNWVGGPNLFPGAVLSGYHADYNKYNAETWGVYVLNQCRANGTSGVASTNSFSAINSGTPKVRYWFGYCYGGHATTPADYTRQQGAQGSVAYTCG